MISLFLNTSIDFLSIAIVKDGVVLDSFYTKLNNDLSKITLSGLGLLLGLGLVLLLLRFGHIVLILIL